MSPILIFQLPKPTTKHQPIAVRLDFSDDDDVYNANNNGEFNLHIAEYSENEHSSDRDFITDGSVSEQYSDSSSSEKYHKKSKRQRRSPKKRAMNGRKQVSHFIRLKFAFLVTKDEILKKASPSVMDSFSFGYILPMKM